MAETKFTNEASFKIFFFFVFKVCAQFENALHCDDMWICEDANESLGSVICMQRALPSSIVVVVMVPLRGCVRLIYFFIFYFRSVCVIDEIKSEIAFYIDAHNIEHSQ